MVGTIGRVPPRRSWDTRTADIAISAAIVADGELRGMYHKMLLPNYEVFNEARNFAPGDRPARAVADRRDRGGRVDLRGLLVRGRAAGGARRAAGARILLLPNASPFHLEKPARPAHARDRGRAPQRRPGRLHQLRRRPGRARVRRRLGGGRGRRARCSTGRASSRRSASASTCRSAPPRPVTGRRGPSTAARARRACPRRLPSPRRSCDARRAGVAGARARHARLRAQERRRDGGARAVRRHRRRADRVRRGGGAGRGERARHGDAGGRTRRRRSSRTRASSRDALGIDFHVLPIDDATAAVERGLGRCSRSSRCRGAARR